MRIRSWGGGGGVFICQKVLASLQEAENSQVLTDSKKKKKKGKEKSIETNKKPVPSSYLEAKE